VVVFIKSFVTSVVPDIVENIINLFVGARLVQFGGYVVTPETNSLQRFQCCMKRSGLPMKNETFSVVQSFSFDRLF
jgi:hypothetical protein